MGWLTTLEVLKVLNISQRTLRRYVKNGLVRAERVRRELGGFEYRYDRDNVFALIDAEKEVPPEPEAPEEDAEETNIIPDQKTLEPLYGKELWNIISRGQEAMYRAGKFEAMVESLKKENERLNTQLRLLPSPDVYQSEKDRSSRLEKENRKLEETGSRMNREIAALKEERLEMEASIRRETLKAQALEDRCRQIDSEKQSLDQTAKTALTTLQNMQSDKDTALRDLEAQKARLEALEARLKENIRLEEEKSASLMDSIRRDYENRLVEARNEAQKAVEEERSRIIDDYRKMGFFRRIGDYLRGK